MKANMGYSDTDPTPNPSPSWEGSGYRILLWKSVPQALPSLPLGPIGRLLQGSWGRFSDHSISKELRVDSYYFMDDDVVIYVRQSDVEDLKSVLAKLKDFSGTVLPLDSYLTSVKNIPIANVGKSFQAFDLQGRAVTAPQHGRLYIRNHKKIVWNE